MNIKTNVKASPFTFNHSEKPKGAAGTAGLRQDNPSCTGITFNVLRVALLLCVPAIVAAQQSYYDCRARTDENCLFEGIEAAKKYADTQRNGQYYVIFLGSGVYHIKKYSPPAGVGPAFALLVQSPIWLLGRGAGQTSIGGNCEGVDVRDGRACSPGFGNEFSILKVVKPGALIVDQLTIRNSVSQYGGAIFNDGASVQVYRSNIINNRTNLSGGGIYNGGSMYVQDCTIHGNKTLNGYGGGIANEGSMTIAYSTISGNQTTEMGSGSMAGIANFGDLNMHNSTIFGNKDVSLARVFYGHVGGLFNGPTGKASLKYVTVTQNVAMTVPYPCDDNDINPCIGAGGVYSVRPFSMNIEKTIIAANNFAGADNFPGGSFQGECVGSLVSFGGNVLGDETISSLNHCSVDSYGPADQKLKDAPEQVFGTPFFLKRYVGGQLTLVLGPGPQLQDNGGLACTVALADGSLAIDKRRPAPCETYDQRWAARNNGHCDAGAVQFYPGTPGKNGLKCTY